MNLKIIPFCILLTLLSTACEPKPIDPAEATLPQLVGHWEWYKTTQALPPDQYSPRTPENTGNTELLVITGDKTWSWSRNDTLVGRGTFALSLWRDTIGFNSYGDRLYADLYNELTGRATFSFYRIFTEDGVLHLSTGEFPLRVGAYQALEKTVVTNKFSEI